MDHECNEIISEEFILKHLTGNNDLIEKYNKFKKRAEIINDKNKKQCPHPNCESFLQKSEESKYVKCENGHKYCYECLKAPHGDKSCDYKIEKQFAKWTKGKRVKRCPRCKMYTEKNEGCNHMTCVSCKYQWCWLCEGKYAYGHYDSGKCKGHQFTRADNLKQIEPCCKCKWGLHKLFPCVCKTEIELLDAEGCWESYLGIIGFWILGIAAIFVFTIMDFYDFYRMRHMIEEKNKTIFNVFIVLISLCLVVCFQVQLFCLLTPFMLIALVYSNFFNSIVFFFGIGK